MLLRLGVAVRIVADGFVGTAGRDLPQPRGFGEVDLVKRIGGLRAAAGNARKRIVSLHATVDVADQLLLSRLKRGQLDHVAADALKLCAHAEVGDEVDRRAVEQIAGNGLWGNVFPVRSGGVFDQGVDVLDEGQAVIASAAGDVFVDHLLRGSLRIVKVADAAEEGVVGLGTIPYGAW